MHPRYVSFLKTLNQLTSLSQNIKMAVNPLDEVLSLLSTDGFSEKPHDSLGEVLNILEDLDTKLDVITDDDPLDQVIDTLENLGDTFNFLQGAEQTTESIAKQAFEKLESSPKDFQKGLENLFKEIYSGRDTNEDLEYFSEDKNDDNGVLADTASFFGDTLWDIVGLEDDTLTYIDLVIMIVTLLVFILVIFSLLVFVALCKRMIRGRSSFRPYTTSDLSKSYESMDSGDCSVSWISINTDSTRTSASSLPSLENIETGLQRPAVKKNLRGWTVAEISPSVLV